MSLLVTFADCEHVQLLTEVGETSKSTPAVPCLLYPLDADEENSIQPGNAMTCVTCNTTRIVETAV